MAVLTFFALIALLIMTGLMLGRLNTLEAALRGLDYRLSDLTRHGFAAPVAKPGRATTSRSRPIRMTSPG